MMAAAFEGRDLELKTATTLEECWTWTATVNWVRLGKKRVSASVAMPIEMIAVLLLKSLVFTVNLRRGGCPENSL